MRRNKTAVIVETRKHKALEFVLNNVATNLNDDWGIQIFYGRGNDEYIKNIITKNNLENRIFCSKLDVDELPHDDYVKLFSSADFWNTCLGETILIFQVDSMLCPNSEFDISDFEHFDYIGGYWGNTEYPLDEEYPVVMNGGLSIRKKQFMLDIIKNKLKPYLENGGNPCEDYFVSACLENKPATREVRNFVIDNGYISPLNGKAPFGLHSSWGTNPSKGQGRYYEEIKKVCPEIETLKSLQYIETEQQWWDK